MEKVRALAFEHLRRLTTSFVPVAWLPSLEQDKYVRGIPADTLTVDCLTSHTIASSLELWLHSSHRAERRGKGK
jgi:hypothetical protein